MGRRGLFICLFFPHLIRGLVYLLIIFSFQIKFYMLHHARLSFVNFIVFLESFVRARTLVGARSFGRAFSVLPIGLRLLRLLAYVVLRNQRIVL